MKKALIVAGLGVLPILLAVPVADARPNPALPFYQHTPELIQSTSTLKTLEMRHCDNKVRFCWGSFDRPQLVPNPLVPGFGGPVLRVPVGLDGKPAFGLLIETGSAK
jgi:hypothetical protein